MQRLRDAELDLMRRAGWGFEIEAGQGTQAPWLRTLGRNAGGSGHPPLMTDRLEQLRSAWPGGVEFYSILVDRAITGTFAPDERARARELADGYDASAKEQGRSRVLLAAVRWSSGN